MTKENCAHLTLHFFDISSKTRSQSLERGSLCTRVLPHTFYSPHSGFRTYIWTTKWALLQYGRLSWIFFCLLGWRSYSSSCNMLCLQLLMSSHLLSSLYSLISDWIVLLSGQWERAIYHGSSIYHAFIAGQNSYEQTACALSHASGDLLKDIF